MAVGFLLKLKCRSLDFEDRGWDGALVLEPRLRTAPNEGRSHRKDFFHEAVERFYLFIFIISLRQYLSGMMLQTSYMQPQRASGSYPTISPHP